MEYLDKIQQKAEEIVKEKGRCVIAVDGRCGSGKSTLALVLAKRMNARCICMDDFFLPPELRTPERLNEAGGNIHYERFADEVVGHLDDEKLVYGIFKCSIMRIDGVSCVENKGVIIVEGSYSTHDRFGKYYDFAVFCDVGSDEQVRRIEKRNGPMMLKRFTGEWIPMEEKYFAAQNTESKCEFTVKTDMGKE